MRLLLRVGAVLALLLLSALPFFPTGAVSAAAAQPTVTGVSPRSGPTSAGNMVTVPAQSAGTHDVDVTTSDGRSVSNSLDKYTYK